MVTNATWIPLYDVRARLSTNNKEQSTVRIQYRGSISQSTGEDWNDVALELSTASPLVGSAIPILKPTVIRHFGGRKSKSVGLSYSMAPSKSIKKRSAVVQMDETSINATFIVEGLSTIASNTSATSENHKVAIAEIDLAAELDWVVVPLKKESAFLRVRTLATNFSLNITLKKYSNSVVRRMRATMSCSREAPTSLWTTTLSRSPGSG